MFRYTNLLKNKTYLNETIKSIRNHDLINFESNYKNVKNSDLQDLRYTVKSVKKENKDLMVRNYHNNIVACFIPFIGSVQYISVKKFLDIIPEEGLFYPLLSMSLEVSSGLGFLASISYPLLYYFESEKEDIIKKNKEILDIIEKKLK